MTFLKSRSGSYPFAMDEGSQTRMDNLLLVSDLWRKQKVS